MFNSGRVADNPLAAADAGGNRTTGSGSRVLRTALSGGRECALGLSSGTGRSKHLEPRSHPSPGASRRDRAALDAATPYHVA